MIPIVLDARVTEHELNDADVDAVSEQPAGAFVPQVVPTEVDPLKLLAIPRDASAARLRLVSVRQQLQGLPGRLDVWLIRSGLGSE